MLLLTFIIERERTSDYGMCFIFSIFAKSNYRNEEAADLSYSTDPLPAIEGVVKGVLRVHYD